MNTYKYWLFYYKENEELYAYTCDKDLYKSFKSQRNMDLYVCKKLDLSVEEVGRLANEQKDLILKDNLIPTWNNNKKIYVSMTMTQAEISTLMEASCTLVTNGIYLWVWTPPEIFKKEYRRALKDIFYTRYNKYLRDGDVLMYDDVEVDELAMFIKLYGEYI